MVKETSRGIGERGAEGMESREPHHCVLWRACHPAFENCNAFPPLVYLFIYIISFFPALCQLLHPSTNERERERYEHSKLQRHFAHMETSDAAAAARNTLIMALIIASACRCQRPGSKDVGPPGGSCSDGPRCKCEIYRSGSRSRSRLGREHATERVSPGGHGGNLGWGTFLRPARHSVSAFPALFWPLRCKCCLEQS